MLDVESEVYFLMPNGADPAAALGGAAFLGFFASLFDLICPLAMMFSIHALILNVSDHGNAILPTAFFVRAGLAQRGRRDTIAGEFVEWGQLISVHPSTPTRELIFKEYSCFQG